MADEAVLAVPGQENLTYTLKQYMTYANTLQEKARQLSRAGQSASHNTLDWSHEGCLLIRFFVVECPPGGTGTLVLPPLH